MQSVALPVTIALMDGKSLAIAFVEAFVVVALVSAVSGAILALILSYIYLYSLLEH